MPLRNILRVVVVDDMSTSRRIVLQALGIDQVIHAVNGLDGLSLADIDVSDLILSDLYVPKLDGISFLQGLRFDLATQAVPFILFSSRGCPEESERFRAFVANGFLAKPFGLVQFKACVEDVVGRLQ